MSAGQICCLQMRSYTQVCCFHLRSSYTLAGPCSIRALRLCPPLTFAHSLVCDCGHLADIGRDVLLLQCVHAGGRSRGGDYAVRALQALTAPHFSPTRSFAIAGIWRIQSGTYCCYNAFTRVDVRVEVTMPGSVNAYVLDAQGRRYGCDDRMWQEVLISATLRALNRPNIFTTHIDGLRSFYPFQR